MTNDIGEDFWKRHSHRPPDGNYGREGTTRRSSEQLREDYFRLEQRVEKLSLVCRALWELLSKDKELEKRDLIAKVAEIDLRDGDLDDRLKPPVLDCPNCGHKVNAKNRHCIYCGFDGFPRDVFEAG